MNKVFVFSKNNYWLAAFAMLSLAGCNKPTEEINSINSGFTDQYLQIEQQKALALARHYLSIPIQHDHISRGPSGTIILGITEIETNRKRTFFMLPDQQHLIEGTLHSPLNAQHNPATRNTAAQRKMRDRLSTALNNGSSIEEIKQTTTSVIKERSAPLINAPVNNTNTMGKIETAKPPKINSLVNKDVLLKNIEKADWISEGEGNKHLYVFFDFKCHACLEVHGILNKVISSHDIQLRYLPVGALGQDSQTLAAISLIPEKNSNRLKLLNKLTANMPLSEILPSTPPEQDMKKGTLRALQNFKLLLDSKRVATPTFAYRTKAGAQISVLTSKEQLEQVIESIIES